MRSLFMGQTLVISELPTFIQTCKNPGDTEWSTYQIEQKELVSKLSEALNSIDPDETDTETEKQVSRLRHTSYRLQVEMLNRLLTCESFEKVIEMYEADPCHTRNGLLEETVKNTEITDQDAVSWWINTVFL
jgi:hypothetical protein